MRIGIDGYEANVSHRVGIGWYAYELLRHIYKEAEKRNHEVVVYLPEQPLSDLPPERLRWNYVVCPLKKFWTFVGLPWSIYTSKPPLDVFFSPTHYIPRWIQTPRAMAIMDLSYLSYPELFRSQDLHKLTTWTAYSAKHAEAIFTISDFSRNAIIQTYKKVADSVTITYPGYRMQDTKDSSFESVQKRHGLARDFILSVGTIQPRKNYERLIAAFAECVQKNAKTFDTLELVIVGKKGWLYDEILTCPQKYGIESRVKFLDFVSDDDLSVLYDQAQCLALVSLYEGFGLPVLEAMAHECPVVVSNVSSLPEIAGDAGIYVQPEDVSSIAKGLDTAVSQKNLQPGKRRIAVGKKRVDTFRWETAAAKTLDVLESIAQKTL